MKFEKNTVLMAAALLLAGCQRETATSYTIPKETYGARLATVSPGAGDGHAPAMPHLHWDLPEGWQEKTGENARMGSFQIPGADGKSAEVRIVPLRAGGGIAENTVNMWRGELGLSEVPTNSISGADVEVGDLKAKLYDLSSETNRFQGKFKARTTAAILPRDGMLWFIKMSGEESTVAAQQDAFRKFLKSLEFHESSHDDHQPSDEPAVAARSNVSAPATWTEKRAGAMILAAYQAKNGEATADITISSFPGDVGGLLANVNRWRGQVGAAEISTGDLAKEVKSIQLADGTKASLVDVTGKSSRLVGLIVPRGDKTWFYKMVGDSGVVAAETDNLIKFAVTVF